MNFREKDRVAVNLICSFKRGAHSFTGRVKNMSRIGLLTICNSSASKMVQIKTGENWQVEIELPVYHSFAPNAFYCQAIVVRVEAEGRNTEIAFRIDRMIAADLRSKVAEAPPAKQLVM